MTEATKHVVKPMEEYEVAELSTQISKFLELNLDIKIANFKIKRIDGLYLSGADALALPDEHIIYIDSSFILEEAANAVKKDARKDRHRKHLQSNDDKDTSS